MQTADPRETKLNAYSSADSGADHAADSWVSPIAPTESSPTNDSFLRDQAFGATPGDDEFYQPARESDWQPILTSFRSHRKLIVGTAMVAALSVVGLAYAFWPSAGEKATTQAAETTSAVQSSPVAPVPAAPRISEPSRAGLSVVAWPDLPASGTLEASPQIAAAAPAGNIATLQTVPMRQNLVFVQRPSVNIRSTPSATGIVLGTAPKGTRFKVAKRDGDWVQVESDRVKGWINSQFLGPNKP
jgi:hypothetical protein